MTRPAGIRLAILLTSTVAALATGCGSGPSASGHPGIATGAAFVSPGHQTYYRVSSMNYDPANHLVALVVQTLPHGPLTEAAYKKLAGERTIDTSVMQGVFNLATSAYANRPVAHVRVLAGLTQSQSAGFVATGGPLDESRTMIEAVVPRSLFQGTSASVYGHWVDQGFVIPPPGVVMDPTMRPSARPTALRAQKLTAVLRVAQSKLGTPYIWGHNEDRGQYGFDCSNYVEYVFHHALGYLFTDWSVRQYKWVGTPEKKMQPGDLVYFEQGRHCGIYAGGGRMIQEGGGLGKVGYLPLKPGSTWYHRISAIKRMF